jgi:hypothetical protein
MTLFRSHDANRKMKEILKLVISYGNIGAEGNKKSSTDST